RMKTPGGRVLAWDYDTMGRLTARTGTDGQKTRYGYEGKLLRTITDGQGRTYRLTFDDRYNLTMMEYPNGLFRRWSYDRRGRLAEEVDVKGNATRYGYDEADNLIRLEEPDGNTHRFEYDAMGNMVHAQDGIREVKFTYGALGVLKSREQERHRITFGYNSELQLKRIGNEAGEDYRFELDGLGQVTAETGFDGIRREYERDGAGNVVRVARPGGKWTRYEYDGEGNILRELQYDGEESLYTYDKDGLLVKAGNGECLTELVRDRKTGRVTEEKQGGHSVRSEYDKEGNRTRVTSTLGADIRHAYDRDGYLQSMQAGEGWKASWMRDSAGLEMQRTCSGGITVRTERDRFGRETRKSVRSGSIERGAWRYEWGMADRLLSKENELTGTVMRYDYDRFDFLIRQETTKGSATDVIYRVPDFVGNLYGTPERKDRRYGAGGRLLEDAECIYHYDDEGNLVFREFRQPREDVVRHDRRQMEREYGIRRPVTDMGWIYEWTSGGMLRRVVRPDGRSVEFRYDALGRRTAKQYLGKVTRWVWDGNTPLHEWVAAVTDNDGREEASCPDGNSLTTWVFEEGTFVPAAKIRGDRQCSIVSDYMGTPVQMYDSEGNKIWDCTLDIYGKVADFRGESLHDCPFRFQGQYEDIETGLYYNRFRYYDPSVGLYISQDPIGLQGSMQLYAYVHTPNSWIDSLGLKKYIVYQAPVLDANGKPTGKVYTGRTSGADDMTRQQILNRRKSNHHRKDIGQLVAIFETNNYKTVRGAEHYYIEEARKTGEAADQIAGISDRNFGKNGKKLKGDEYMEAFFKEKSDLKQPKSSELSIYH
ncbi:RHS repeat-associated core domain-containing protein, partial [Parabacteroides merdae]|uniref:RHS repeat-associated core domain-containing protein n=1 Tax=Parabacteroides merdae TaxID=46503 RepID=UPI003D2D0368